MRRALRGAFGFAALGWSAGVLAAGPVAAPSGSSSPVHAARDADEVSRAASATPRPPLSPLPKPPSLEIPPPDEASLTALDAHLSRLVSKDRAVREDAVREVLEVERDRLPALHRRLMSLAESSDHEAMKAVLVDLKERAKDSVKGLSDEEKEKHLDYLELLGARARPDAKPWRDVVSAVAMARMLTQIGTTPAARELIGVYARFGEFLRLEMQRQLSKMGEQAVAALVEAERHPAKKVSTWAARQLDALGKAIPGEAVQTNDPEVLADVLRAYGRIRDPDAARLVISFTSSERTQIRDAARQAVVLMGEVANWQLRDTYENVVGKKPPREWSWERIARELFSEFDRMRLSAVYVLFDQAVAAEKAGKLEEMAELYDRILSQSPVFERAAEMIPGYLAYARAHLDDAPEGATRALSRVVRLASEGDPAAKTAKSLLLTLEAEALIATHVADATLTRRALEVDPSNARARQLQDRMSRGDLDVDDRTHRYVGAGAVGAVAALASLFILLRRKKPEPDAVLPAPAPAPAPTAPSAPADADADPERDA